MCASCEHSVSAHCDGIGRCNALVTDTNLSLAECNCPGFTEREGR
jgi:hypothetical protein